jgi:hypothetical protein
MGLKEAFQKAAIVAFNAAGNVKKSAVYSSNPNPTYNTATGKVTENATDYPIIAIREDYKFNDVDGLNVKPEDIKWLVLYSELEISLKEKDYITVGGTRWNVVNWQLDPAAAVWTIQVRQ